MPLDIHGIAAFPRLSENDVFYWPQELAKFDGQTVPLRWMHIQSNEAIIGEATFRYDEDNRQVLYSATVTNEDAATEIRKGGFKVSIGASVSETSTICHKDGKCAEAPILDKIQELSVVNDPGLPETTLNIIEGLGISLRCGSPLRITSVKESSTKSQLMTDEVNPTKECQEAPKAEETPKFEQDPCPEGWTLVDGKCVKDAVPEEKEAAPEATVDAPKDVNVNVNVQKEEAAPVDVEKLKTEMKAELLDSISKDFTPKTEVKAEGETKVEDGWSVDAIKEGLAKGQVTLKLDKEEWIANNTQKTVTEAVSTSGTVPGVKLTNDIIVIPGSNTFKPLRSFGQFEAIPTGQNTAKFWTIDVAAFGAITESTSTDITASTHNLTAIDVTTSTRGVLQQVLKSQFEDFPPKFLEKLKDVLRMAAVKDEHNLIVQTLASTNNDFNDGNTSLQAGFPAHISGEDGTFVDAIATEDAVGEFQKEGITTGRRYLEERGHVPENEKVIAILAPRAYDSLVNDSDISRFIQEGDPSISKTGLLSKYFGIEIMVSNELLVQNNSYRNLIIVSGKAFALASQREMEVEMDKEIAGQYINIVVSHRIGVEELDHTAYVIASSKQD